MGWVNEPGTLQEAALGLPYLTADLAEVSGITQKSLQGWRIEIDREPCDARLIGPEHDDDDMSVAKNGKARGVWRRQGAYTQILELGPRSVPDILRR